MSEGLIGNKLMAYAISPKHTTDFGKGGWTIEKKIEVFIARVEGWQLDIAKKIIEDKIHGRGFALLHLIMSYFEMIAKYSEGYTDKKDSKKYFIKGVLLVFPPFQEIKKNYKDSFEMILDLLYKNVRSGMYHMGLIGERILLTGDIPAPLEYDSGRGSLKINPDLLVYAVIKHFKKFKEELQNPDNKTLRLNFEKRFDYDTRG